MPGKPFSGKQKKEQLKLKREEKRAKADHLRGQLASDESHEDDDTHNDDETEQKTVEKDVQNEPLVRGGRPGTGDRGKGGGRHDDGTNSVASSTMKLGADKKGVRSVFAKETDRTVEERKKLSYAPIVTRDFRPGVAFGSWFELLSGPALDTGTAAYSPTFPFSISLPTRVMAQANVPEELLREAQEAGRTADNPTEAEESVIFSHWLKQLDRIHEKLPASLRGMEINLFERNLDTWRQLWRTVELSDVVVVAADARYPIMHLPLSLLHYVKRVNQKPFVVVLNKVDLVPESHVVAWKHFLQRYFVATGIAASVEEIPILSFSCLPEAETVTATENQRTDKRRSKKKRNMKLYEELHSGHLRGNSDDDDDDDDQDSDEYGAEENFRGKSKAEAQLSHGKRSHKELAIVAKMIDEILVTCKKLATGKPRQQSRKERPQSKRSLPEERSGGDVSATSSSSPPSVYVGLVGHPNVGKSSLINCIRGTKVVSVSATAGHTKHLQTIPIPSDGVTLVDCPGLAFPVLGVPRQLQAVIGTHQIAQTRDPQSSVGYLATRLPLEKLYGLRKIDGIESDPWSSFELCESYATKKGFMVKHGRGIADVHRAAIELLKEAYEGRLVLYFSPPPQCEQYLDGAGFKRDVAPLLLLQAFTAQAALVPPAVA
jgi:ribosome biogenesis GTPase A